MNKVLMFANPKTYDRWTQKKTVGDVGAVGDVNMQIRLKQSMPELPPRYSQTFSRGKLPAHGTRVTFSDDTFMPKANPKNIAKVTPGAFVNNLYDTYNYKMFQDLQEPEKSDEPVLGSTPQYGWKNKVANVFKARVTGRNFLPVPGAPIQQGVPRGGATPRVVAINDEYGLASNTQDSRPVTIGGSTRPNRK